MYIAYYLVVESCSYFALLAFFRSRFFSVFDFNKILQKAYDAEFIPPAATSMTDVRNFDKEFTSEPAAGCHHRSCCRTAVVVVVS